MNSSNIGITLSRTSVNFSTMNSLQSDLDLDIYLPQLKVEIKLSKRSLFLLCWDKINLNHTVSPNLDFGDFFNAIKKQPSASVKPANQCKSLIFLLSIFGANAGSKFRKANLKLSDIYQTLSVVLIDNIIFRLYKVKCFSSVIKVITSLKSRK